MQFNYSHVIALSGAMLAGSAAIIGASLAHKPSTMHTGWADEGPMPDLSGAISWLNSPPLSRDSLRGKVVLIDFWTYTCINSLRPLPYVKGWAAKYKDKGLVVIGVHTPEFSFEKLPANVQQAVGDLKVTYPVAIDSDYKIWNAFKNDYWPAQYLVDGNGEVLYHHLGEGDYVGLEHRIQRLLIANGASGIDSSTVKDSGVGIEAAPSDDVQSPESYIGAEKAKGFASAGGLAQNSPTTYSVPSDLSLNQWGLGGLWNVGEEAAVLQTSPGAVVFRFHSRDLHLVMAPAANGTPVRFKVSLDGVAPGVDHGSDTLPDGSGEVVEPRLYQLIRQTGPIRDRTFTIQFLDPGVRALDFTFG